MTPNSVFLIDSCFDSRSIHESILRAAGYIVCPHKHVSEVNSMFSSNYPIPFAIIQEFRLEDEDALDLYFKTKKVASNIKFIFTSVYCPSIQIDNGRAVILDSPSKKTFLLKALQESL